MLWSILITSVPSRIASCLSGLITNLNLQTRFEPNVEILALLDNKQRTIGAKRNLLLNMAQGDYVSYIDDDDEIASDYVARILNAIEKRPDVITFDVLCTVGKQKKYCHYDINYNGVRCKNLENGDEEWFTRPYHLHVWKKEVVGWFPNINLGEDIKWADNIDISNLKQIKLEEILYYYRWDPKNTEITGR